MEENPPFCHLRSSKEQVYHIKNLVTFSKSNRLDKNNTIQGQQIYNIHKKGEKRWQKFEHTIMKIFSTNSEDENKARR